MGVRFVPEGWGAMGFDPAGTYRPFGDQMDRKERLGVARSSAPSQPGERRPEGEEGPSQPGTEAGRPSPAPSSAGPGPADR